MNCKWGLQAAWVAIAGLLVAGCDGKAKTGDGAPPPAKVEIAPSAVTRRILALPRSAM